MYWLGIDIGGTKVNIGLLDEDKNVVLHHMEKLPENKSEAAIVKWLKDRMDALFSEKDIFWNQILACGMGVPGTVSADGRIAIKIPNLGWKHVPLAKEFENLAGIPTILVQDSRAAAYGEYKAGNGQGKKSVICITLGTGIGTGMVIDGRIFDGALGGAGELGHIPAVLNGRECGCGKRGCLESYVAGKGLDITAKAVWGAEFTARDIFEFAEKGDAKARDILQEAISLLGNAIVSALNLISPNCLLFSGGMSRQKELFIDPLLRYIKEHCYSLAEAEDVYMGIAGLGENAPMVGAALLSQNIRIRKPKMSASIMCADMLHFEKELEQLVEAGIDYLHCDIMDGHFVPNLMLPMEMLNKIRKGTRLPLDIHLMTEKPENIIPLLDLKEGDIVSVHYESTPHVQRALALIQAQGAIPALALNPSTPIECVRELLEDIRMVLIMTVNPGYAGQKIIKQCFDKISRMRKYLDDLGYPHILIEVDGNCSFENVPKLQAAGAELFVLGSSSVFDANFGILEGTKYLQSLLRSNTPA